MFFGNFLDSHSSLNGKEDSENCLAITRLFFIPGRKSVAAAAGEIINDVMLIKLSYCVLFVNVCSDRVTWWVINPGKVVNSRNQVMMLPFYFENPHKHASPSACEYTATVWAVMWKPVADANTVKLFRRIEVFCSQKPFSTECTDYTALLCLLLPI